MARACRTYFDWHPVTGAIVVLAASTLATTALYLLCDRVVPAADGWPICTPLNGVVLAVLLMSRRKLWPFILLGYMLALSKGTALIGTTYSPPFLAMMGNTAELALAAFTLPPYRSLKQWLREPRLLRAFTGYALILGPAIMALTVAQSTMESAAAVSRLHPGFWDRFRVVGLSEALGVALGTSLVLVLFNPHTYRLFHWTALPKTVGLFSLLALATWFDFMQTLYPAEIFPYAILIAIAFFLGIRGAVLGTALFGAIVSFHAAHGPLLAGHAMSPQGSIVLAVITIFPLSVTLFHRSELEIRVRDSQVELDKLKSLDRLTGVANRKRFDLVLTREWQRAIRNPKPVALLMIDTDFFDLYNQQYGTHAGDICLRLIATKLAEQPHRQYDLVSRFEGGRFSVLLPGASGDAVKRIAEQFRAEIAALDWPHERSQFGRVTVSVGWAFMVPEINLPSELLVSAAESALSSAKKNGKNRVEGFPSKVIEMPAAAR